MFSALALRGVLVAQVARAALHRVDRDVLTAHPGRHDDRLLEAIEHVDDGAVRVLTSGGSSLLPVGVTGHHGDFLRGELVACLDRHGREVARGLVNYAARHLELIKGQASSEIEALLGFKESDEVIHRDNLVLTG